MKKFQYHCYQIKKKKKRKKKEYCHYGLVLLAALSRKWTISNRSTSVAQKEEMWLFQSGDATCFFVLLLEKIETPGYEQNTLSINIDQGFTGTCHLRMQWGFVLSLETWTAIWFPLPALKRLSFSMRRADRTRLFRGTATTGAERCSGFLIETGIER